MNLTYLTFPDLPLTYPIFSGTWAFQISDCHLKNKKKMASLYVWEGLAMWVFWIFDLPRPTGVRYLKSERQAYKDLLLYVKRSTFFFFVIFGPSHAVRKPVSWTIRRRNFQQVEVTIQAVRRTFTTC